VPTVRDRAEVVVIGAGVGGASIAHHLAEAGCRDLVVLDRAEPTSGSTFHSAGLVGQLRGSLPLTRMMMHSVDVYRRLEAAAADTGRSPGWREVGSLRLASTPERLDELRRQNGWAKTFGLPMELLSAREAHELFPLMDPTGVLGAAWLPTDGYLDPSGLTYALLGGATSAGVTVETGVRVTDLVASEGRIRRVVTDHGTIEAEAVVIACGMYTPQVAALAGVTVPIVPMAHQYLITRDISGVTPDLPQLRDPDNLVYFRPEGSGLVLGGYERDPAPWSVDGVPADFNNRLLTEDWDRFAPLMSLACQRVPAAEDASIVQLINGPEGFTPDNEFVLGESVVAGLFVAAGFCAHGIAGAGGVGRVMAEWIVDGEPSFDTWKMDIRRFGAAYRSRDHAVARTVEVYATYYDIHYPNEERQAGRPLRRSPAYPALGALGCSFGEKSGWERPNWFSPNAASAVGGDDLRPRGWAGQHWSPAIEVEALACRDTVALFDETSFSKMEVAGPGAARFLSRICANDVDRAVGSVTYTQLLNDRGGIECDLTATRLAADRYMLVTGTALGVHDLGWIHKQQALLPSGDGCVARDVTAAWACFGLWGPAARALLQPLTRSSLANEDFPYLTARSLSLGAVPVVAVRVTFVGELGWELYCPTEYGATLWDLLWSAGSDGGHGLVAGGYRAIDALRVEKGYRVWGVDITPEDTPYEAGLGFAVKLDKSGGFVGRDALVAAKAAGPRRRLRCLVLDDPLAVPLGSEPVRVGGDIVGRVTSGNQGYRVGKAIAFAYLPADRAALGTCVEIEVFGDWIGAEIVKDPVYDPTGSRIRA
jgi:4-methylaminobutanoate oxidase (formaldehyde-forming)